MANTATATVSRILRRWRGGESVPSSGIGSKGTPFPDMLASSRNGPLPNHRSKIGLSIANSACKLSCSAATWGLLRAGKGREDQSEGGSVMAKKNKEARSYVKMQSSESAHCYYTERNRRN